MVYTPSPELRQCMIEAIGGDHEAARQVLRIFGYANLARQVVRGKPFSNRIQRAVAVLTAGGWNGMGIAQPGRHVRERPDGATTEARRESARQ
jgi:hypothetical protein